MISEQAKSLQKYCQSAEIEKIADNYGLEHQLSVTNGELIELIHAIQDYSLKLALNDPNISKSHMIEEIADVIIMCEQLVHLTESNEEFEAFEELKIKRQLGRIAEERKDV